MLEKKGRCWVDMRLNCLHQKKVMKCWDKYPYGTPCTPKLEAKAKKRGFKCATGV